MKSYIPKDHRVLSWDPENMDTYWRQCKKFDLVTEQSSLKRDELSQKGFRQLARH